MEYTSKRKAFVYFFFLCVWFSVLFSFLNKKKKKLRKAILVTRVRKKTFNKIVLFLPLLSIHWKLKDAKRALELSFFFLHTDKTNKVKKKPKCFMMVIVWNSNHQPTALLSHARFPESTQLETIWVYMNIKVTEGLRLSSPRSVMNKTKLN